jgi:hypothetical protein
MRLFSKKQSYSSEVFGRSRLKHDQVKPSKNLFYHSSRSTEPGMASRQPFRNPVNIQTASRAASYSLQRFGLLIVIIVAVVSMVNILMVSPKPNIVLLDKNRVGYLHTINEYQQAAQKLFEASFTNNNKITINTDAISKALVKEFPELSSVTIKLPLIDHNPIVYLEPDKPLLALSMNNGLIYAVDSAGLALGAINSTVVNSLHLTAVQDEGTIVIQAGQPILPGSTVSFIQTIGYQLSQKQLNIAKLMMPAGENELDMYLTGQSYYVKFNLADSSPLQEIGTFLAVRQNLQQQGTTPSQYIDVRVDGRAYYK